MATFDYIFFYVDGTAIHEKPEHDRFMVFSNSISYIRGISNKVETYKKFRSCTSKFLRVCRSHDSYGTPDNFASFLKQCELFPGKSFDDYRKFVWNFINSCKECESMYKPYDRAGDVLESLKSRGFKIWGNTNWFMTEQIFRLEKTGLWGFFDGISTIDNNYAKPSINNYIKLLKMSGVSDDSFCMMVGNSTSDLVPNGINVASVIIRQPDSIPSKEVKERGIIVDYDEILDPSFPERIMATRRL